MNTNKQTDQPEKEKPDYGEIFKSLILDQTKDYPDPVPVINLIQGDDTYPLLTKMSYSLWQGKAKSKKTTVLAMAIAAFISPVNSEEKIRFEANEDEKGTAIIFDTEQGKSYGAKTMKLILKLAGLKTSRDLIYVDLREYPPSDRIEIIKKGIELTKNVKIVIVDGVVDIMNDFMDAAEGQMVISELLRLSSIFDIHIAGVLHQNKGDKNARGHVGTISVQKGEREIAIEKDPEDKTQSIVISNEQRGLPFDDFAIRWEKGSLPKIVQNWTQVNPTADRGKSSRKKDGAEAFPPSAHLNMIARMYALKDVTIEGYYTSGNYHDQLSIAFASEGGSSVDMKTGRAKQFAALHRSRGYIKSITGLKGNTTRNYINDDYKEEIMETMQKLKLIDS